MDQSVKSSIQRVAATAAKKGLNIEILTFPESTRTAEDAAGPAMSHRSSSRWPSRTAATASWSCFSSQVDTMWISTICARNTGST